MSNLNAIFRKTEAGAAEVRDRALGLRAELRRILILVDGSTPLSRLAVFVRGAEIDTLMAELQHHGLVTPVGAPGSGTELGTPAPKAPDVTLEPTAAQLLAVRQTAILMLHELLGSNAEPLAASVERCSTAQELRVVVTELRQTLDRTLGAATGQRFLEAVRSAAEGKR